MESLPPTPTNLTLASQRRINLIWECTQALVAIMVTASFLYCEINKIESVAVRMGFSLIIGFYFSRTNHSAVGGVGRKANPKYIGR